jgi:hypothetical protein
MVGFQRGCFDQALLDHSRRSVAVSWGALSHGWSLIWFIRLPPFRWGVRIWRGNHVLVVGTSLPLSTTVLLASGPLVSPPRAMTYAN